MSHSAEVWLWDALKAAEVIERFIAGVDADGYAANDLMMSAVERKFEIIGETLKNYSKQEPLAAAALSGLPEIVGFRNKIIHGYRQLDPVRVYQTAITKLPQLRAQLEAALAGKTR